MSVKTEQDVFKDERKMSMKTEKEENDKERQRWL